MDIYFLKNNFLEKPWKLSLFLEKSLLPLGSLYAEI